MAKSHDDLADLLPCPFIHAGTGELLGEIVRIEEVDARHCIFHMMDGTEIKVVLAQRVDEVQDESKNA